MVAPHVQFKMLDSVAVFRKEERSYFVEDDWHWEWICRSYGIWYTRVSSYTIQWSSVVCPNKCAYLKFLHNCKSPESSRFHKNARWINLWFVSIVAFISSFYFASLSRVFGYICNTDRSSPCVCFRALFAHGTHIQSAPRKQKQEL